MWLEKIRRLFRYWKLLTPRKLLYLPRIMNIREKRIILFLGLTVLTSGIILFSDSYKALTISVPAIGGTYTEGVLGEPRTLNPIFATRDAERDINRLIFSGLFTYNEKGILQGDLADRFELSDDGKIYTVFLKKNITWHDNVFFDAYDVAFTIATIQNPLYKSPLRPNWQGVQVEILNPSTIRLTLRTPYNPFIENLTTGIIPKHLWEKISPEQAQYHELNVNPIGTGPYKFSDIKRAKDASLLTLTFIRNEKYYREGPYINNIVFYFFKTEEEMLAQWRNNAIDGYGPVSERYTKAMNTNTVNIQHLQTPRIFGIFFNQQKAPSLKDSAVRQAISYGINRTLIAEEAASGGATATMYPLPSSLALQVSGKAENTFNPEKAREILDKANWTNENGVGIRKKTFKQKGKQTTTETLHFTIITSDWPDLTRTAELIKKELKEIGIEITIESHPFAELESKVIRQRNFEILLFGQVYGYEQDPFPFWHSSQIKDPGLNIALYANKKVDQTLENSRKSNNSEARRKEYDEFQKIITDEIPAVFLYSQLYLYLISKNMTMPVIEKISLPADRFNTVSTWYLQTGRVFKIFSKN